MPEARLVRICQYLGMADVCPDPDDESALIAAVDAAFAVVDRPTHFTDFTHCCECAEHDALLRARDRGTLRLDDVGNPGCDPLCFCSAQGLAWYFPALARLALAECGPGAAWYGEQLQFQLSYGGPDNRLLAYCDDWQRDAVARLLGHLVATRAALIDDYGMADDFLRCHALWSDSDLLAKPAGDTPCSN